MTGGKTRTKTQDWPHCHLVGYGFSKAILTVHHDVREGVDTVEDDQALSHIVSTDINQYANSIGPKSTKKQQTYGLKNDRFEGIGIPAAKNGPIGLAVGRSAGQ